MNYNPTWFCYVSDAPVTGSWIERFCANSWYACTMLFGVVTPLSVAFFIACFVLYKKEMMAREWDRLLAGVVSLFALCGLLHPHAGLCGGLVWALSTGVLPAQLAYTWLFVLLWASALVCARTPGLWLASFFVQATTWCAVSMQRMLSVARAGSVRLQQELDQLEALEYGADIEPIPVPVPEPIINHTVNHAVNHVVQPAGELQERVVHRARYALPELTLFGKSENKHTKAIVTDELRAQARILEEKLRCFGVMGQVTAIEYGPVVTLFEYQPDIDTKISKIIALEDDLALALQTMSIRIFAPVPGKSVVGFEVANRTRADVLFADTVRSAAFTQFPGALPLVLGKDTIGQDIVVDLAQMPHLLVAGSTGSGKSVALNAMLVSLLCARTPEQVRLVLIDPKRLEFGAYADIAHLLFPIVTAPKKAIDVLKWVVGEMESRYQAMAACGAKSITSMPDMPYIVVVIDELADLMMTAGKDVEHLIARIAQMARAAGIHMILATQRPSVDVITGLIKVNFPSRISFRVTSKVDSRTILDTIGAERLLGKGDMLFLHSHAVDLKRVHGAWVTDAQVRDVVAHIRAQRPVVYRDLHDLPNQEQPGVDEGDQELYQEVLHFIREVDEVSISLLQRKFRIGYNRSARIIDMLESHGYVIPTESGKMRRVVFDKCAK